MLKRMLAILLVLAMVLTVLPIGVLADEQTTTETTETTTEATEAETEATEAETEATEAETEAPAAVFALAVEPEQHTSVAGATVLNLYLTADAETTIGSYQFTITAAEGNTFTYAGDATQGENNVIAWVDETGEAPIAVSATPLLVGKLTVTGTYTAGTSIVLTDVEVGETGAAAQTAVEPTYTSVADNSGYHAHGADVAWTAWTATDDLPDETGYYYLTGDVTLTKDQVRLIGAQNVTLCLNGYNITAGDIVDHEDTEDAEKDRIYNIQDDSVLNICDCTAHTDAEGNYVAGKLTGASQGAIMIPNVTGTNEDGSEITCNAVVNFYDGIITENVHSTTGGAILVQDGGTFNMYGGQVTGNHTEDNGAAFYVGGPTSTVNIYDGEISNNSANNYAGIYLTNGTLNIYGGTISGNTVNGKTTTSTAEDGTVTETVTEGNGAGIGVTGVDAILNIRGGTISGNTALNQGGGVYMLRGTVNISGGTISGNSAKQGGGLYGWHYAKANISGGKITGNTATSVGGGICADGMDMEVTGGSVTENTATTQGGGLYLGNGAIVNMYGNTVNGNQSKTGAGMYTNYYTTTVYLYDVTMKENVSSAAGGIAISVFGGSDVIIDSCTITENTSTATSAVGAVYIPNTVASLKIQGTPYIWGNTNSNGSERGIWLQEQGDDATAYAQLIVGNLYEGAKVSIIDNSLTTETPNLIADEYFDPEIWSTDYIVHVLHDAEHIVYNTDTAAFEYADVHAHEGIDAVWNKVGFDANLNELKNGGYYYLADDVELTATCNLSAEVEVTLCLNGYTIKAVEGIRAFRLSNGAKVTFCDCSAHTDESGEYVAGTIVPGSGWAGGAVGYYTDVAAEGEDPKVGQDTVGELNIYDIIIDGAGVVSTARGAGIDIGTGNAALNIDGVVFRNLTTTANATTNYLAGGGAICINYRITANISNTVFENCTAGNGAAIWNAAAGTVLNIDNCTFRNNTTTHSGGVVFVRYNSTVNVSNTTFTGNNCAKSAGALYLYAGAQATLTNVTVTNNTVGGRGGYPSAYAGAVYALSTGTKVTLSGKMIVTGNDVGGADAGMFLQNNSSNTPELVLKDLSADSNINFNTHTTLTDINTLVSVESGEVPEGIFHYQNDGLDYYYDGTQLVAAEAKVHAHEEYADVEWVGVTSLPTTPGYYYLTTNVYNTSTKTIKDIGGEIVLCLNGYSVINASGVRAYSIWGETTTVTLCDCTAYTDADGCYHAGRISGATSGAINVYNDTTEGAVNGATLNLYDGIISGNSATDGGGILVQDGSTFNMYGGLISGNTAARHAGGLFVAGATINMYGGEISNNTAVGYGAGLYFGGEVVFNMEGGKISGNTASGGTYNTTTYNGQGGGLFSNSQNNIITILGGEISGNTAYNGGGMFLRGTVTIDGITVSNNTAENLGGALNANGGTVDVSNVTFTGNSAKTGAVTWMNNSTQFTITDSTVTGNTASSISALYGEGSSNLTINNCSITGNNSEQFGAVYIPNGNTKLTITGDTNITGNYCSKASQELYAMVEQNLYLPKHDTNPARVTLSNLGENAAIGVTVVFEGISREILDTDADYTANITSDSNVRVILANEDYSVMTVYEEGTTDQNPIALNWIWNDAQTEAAVTVTVPAGTTYYYSNTIGGPTLYINGELYGVLNGSFFMPELISITNDTDATVTYELYAVYPVGHQMNPDTLVIGTNTAVIASGSQGYYYNMTVEETGTLTITMPEGDWTYTVNNLTTYAYGDTQWSDSDPVVNPIVLEVTAGDVIELIVNTYDPADMWNTPAGELAIEVIFTYPAGHELNPIWLSAGENALTIPAGQTLYYVGRFGGMTMTAVGEGATVAHNGTTYTLTSEAVTFDCYQAGMWDPSTFVVTNTTDADVAVTLTVNYPLGTMDNPAELVLGENTASVEAGNTQGYYFTWTAAEEGTLVLTMPEGNWQYTVNNLTTYKYGENKTSADETVVNPAEIEVAAGDVIQIIVNSFNPEDVYNNPAAELVVTAAFRKASCDVHTYTYVDNSNGTHTATCSVCEDTVTEAHSYGEDYSESCVCGHTLIKFMGTTATLGGKLQLDFVLNPSSLSGSDNYVVITKYDINGNELDSATLQQSEWGTYSGSIKMVSYNNIAAKEMGDTLTAVLYNAKGQQLSVPYTDSYKGYLGRALANSASNEKLRTLCVDLLNYGAAAQVQFEYNTENLVNADLTEEQQGWATADVTLNNNQVKGTGFVGTTLTLVSEIQLDFMFNPSVIGSDNSQLYAIATYTDYNGKAKEVRIESAAFDKYGSYTQISVTGMVIADYACVVTCTVYDLEGNVVGSGADSVESYASRASSSTATAAKTGVAIAKLGYSAYQYFSK